MPTYKVSRQIGMNTPSARVASIRTAELAIYLTRMGVIELEETSK